MTDEEMTLGKMGVTSIRIRRIHRTEAIGEADTSSFLERHRRGDWGEMRVEAPGENERSIACFHRCSYVLSEYREESEERSVMIFTALFTGRTVIFRRGDLTFPFMMEHLCEMLDLIGE
jgi:L-amino acid N-acyltransferase YncA